MGDVRPGAEAGVGETGRAQGLERFLIRGGTLRLNQYRLVPIEAEPAQILVDVAHELRPAARLVEILDTEQETPAALECLSMAERRAVRMVMNIRPVAQRTLDAESRMMLS